MTVDIREIYRGKSCADGPKAQLLVMGAMDKGVIGIEIKDDEGDRYLIALSPVDASEMIARIAGFLKKVVEG